MTTLSDLADALRNAVYAPRSSICRNCGSTTHHIQQCDKIARFDVETYLREQNLYLYDAIGSALACLRGDSPSAAIVLLEKAMGGKPMTTDDKPGDEKPIDIPDEKPPITPGGPPAPEWRTR